MKRVTDRIDYKKLSTTGERIIKTDYRIDDLPNLLTNLSLADMSQQDESSLGETQQYKKLLLEEKNIRGEILDYVDVYDVKDVCGTIEDINDVLNKVENFRLSFRRVHLELQDILSDYSDRYGNEYDTVMSSLKGYTKDVLNKKRMLRDGESTSQSKDDIAKETTIRFQLDEIGNILLDIERFLDVDLTYTSDQELRRLRQELPSKSKLLRKAGEKIEIVLSAGQMDGIADNIASIRIRYEKLTKNLDKFERIKLSRTVVNLTDAKLFRTLH